MDVVAQILTERPGRVEQEEYEISDLKSVVESSTSERKHVTMYPGDYTGNVGGPTIEIPETVSITILPGAIVEYVDDFRQKSYQVPNAQGGTKTYDGPPQEATDGSGNLIHPLAIENPSTETPIRYAAPLFTGHVENITDLNLASDWSFKQDFERSLWAIRDGDANDLFQVPFGNTVEFRSGNKVTISSGPLPGADEGPFFEVAHESFTTSGSPNNDGTPNLIQTLGLDDGHVTNVKTIESVNELTNSDGYLPVSQNTGQVDITHGGQGSEFVALSDTSNWIDPNSFSKPDGRAVRDFVTDTKGHVRNIEYHDNVEDIQDGFLTTSESLGPALSPGIFEINHAEIEITGSPQNTGTTVIQSINPYDPGNNVESGHIDNVTAVDIVGGGNITVQQDTNGNILVTDGANTNTVSLQSTNVGRQFEADEPVDSGDLVKLLSDGKIKPLSNSTEFIGVAQESGSAEDMIAVSLLGSVSSAHSGLSISEDYYVGASGNITAADTGHFAGTAISSSELLLRGNYA